VCFLLPVLTATGDRAAVQSASNHIWNISITLSVFSVTSTHSRRRSPSCTVSFKSHMEYFNNILCVFLLPVLTAAGDRAAVQSASNHIIFFMEYFNNIICVFCYQYSQPPEIAQLYSQLQITYGIFQ